MVRKKGLEPSRYCYRQPLKLVRLPIPPLPQVDAGAEAPAYFFSGVGAGAGAGAEAGAELFAPLMTAPGSRWPNTPRMIAPIMNRAPRTVVARVRTVAPARAPNAVCVL